MTDNPTATGGISMTEEVRAPLIDRIRGREYAHRAKGNNFDAALLAEAADALAICGATAKSGNWQTLDTAPCAMSVLAARFVEDAGEWELAVVTSPPCKPFTHWRMLPQVSLP